MREMDRHSSPIRILSIATNRLIFALGELVLVWMLVFALLTFTTLPVPLTVDRILIILFGSTVGLVITLGGGYAITGHGIRSIEANFERILGGDQPWKSADDDIIATAAGTTEPALFLRYFVRKVDDQLDRLDATLRNDNDGSSEADVRDFLERTRANVDRLSSTLDGSDALDRDTLAEIENVLETWDSREIRQQSMTSASGTTTESSEAIWNLFNLRFHVELSRSYLVFMYIRRGLARLTIGTAPLALSLFAILLLPSVQGAINDVWISEASPAFVASLVSLFCLPQALVVGYLVRWFSLFRS